MKREIKFRGKSVEDGEWVYGYYVMLHMPKTKTVENSNTIIRTDTELIPSIFNDTKTNIDHSYWWTIDPDTLGKFTGLVDKNGKEIYEGDIVRYTVSGLTIESVVEWDDDLKAFTFIVKEQETSYPMPIMLFDTGIVLEVVGQVCDSKKETKED